MSNSLKLRLWGIAFFLITPYVRMVNTKYSENVRSFSDKNIIKITARVCWKLNIVNLVDTYDSFGNAGDMLAFNITWTSPWALLAYCKEF